MSEIKSRKCKIPNIGQYFQVAFLRRTESKCICLYVNLRVVKEANVGNWCYLWTEQHFGYWMVQANLVSWIPHTISLCYSIASYPSLVCVFFVQELQSGMGCVNWLWAPVLICNWFSRFLSCSINVNLTFPFEYIQIGHDLDSWLSGLEIDINLTIDMFFTNVILHLEKIPWYGQADRSSRW